MWKLLVPKKITAVSSPESHMRLSNVPPLLAACPPVEPECGPCLSTLLREECVKLDLAATTKQEALAELVDVLAEATGAHNKDAALTAVAQRECLASTGLGSGVALPHGIDGAAPGISVAMGISRRGVDFGAEDGKPTHVIFMLLGPPDSPQWNLHALDQAARLLHSPGFVDVALGAESPADLVGFIREGTWVQPPTGPEV